MRVCKITSCNKKHQARGFCNMHYLRLWKNGDPLKTKYNKGPVTWIFLLSCSVINKETGCIEWQKGKTNGYGTIFVNSKEKPAHRVSYELCCGVIPDGMFVCHHCDNRPCINPEHLFLGTCADNIADAVNKGRMAHKLTEEDVRKIREMNGTQRQLAKIFGVGQSNISCVRSRKTWRHIA